MDSLNVDYLMSCYDGAGEWSVFHYGYFVKGMDPYPMGMDPYPVGMDSYPVGTDPYLVSFRNL